MRRLHPDRHKSTAPEEAITRLQSENDRFTAGKSIDRDPMAQVKQAAINPSPRLSDASILGFHPN
jgi:hypothetical protein